MAYIAEVIFVELVQVLEFRTQSDCLQYGQASPLTVDVECGVSLRAPDTKDCGDSIVVGEKGCSDKDVSAWVIR